MYSMVLMAALTTGVDLPDCHRRHGCNGGGYGGSCHGGGGYGGGGCYGGGGYGGGCYGGGGYGGGCYGGGGYGGGGCYGGGGGYAWSGGYGQTMAWGGDYGYAPAMAGYSTTLGPNYASYSPADGRVMSQSNYYSPGTDQAVSGAAPATIILHMPQEANLTVDGNTTRITGSDTRVFTSPPLEPGKTYYYTFRGELNRSGKMVNASQNVEVRAGKTTEVTLNFPGQDGRAAEGLDTPPRPNDRRTVNPTDRDQNPDRTNPPRPPEDKTRPPSR